MWEKLKARYQRLSNPVRAALATAAQTFVGLFATTLSGFAFDVVDWWLSLADADPLNLPFPDWNVLVAGGISASGAAAFGLLTFLFRGAQARGMLKGNPPDYDRREVTTHG